MRVTYSIEIPLGGIQLPIKHSSTVLSSTHQYLHVLLFFVKVWYWVLFALPEIGGL